MKKPTKKQVDTQRAAQLAELEPLYRVKSESVNGLYVTSIGHKRSTTIRLTFTEVSADLQKAFPVCAVTVAAEDLQQWYNNIGDMLQKLREQQRLD